jgi:hypothetical protein
VLSPSESKDEKHSRGKAPCNTEAGTASEEVRNEFALLVEPVGAALRDGAEEAISPNVPRKTETFELATMVHIRGCGFRDVLV